MQRLEVSGAVRPIYGSLGVKRLMSCGSKKGTQIYYTFLPKVPASESPPGSPTGPLCREMPYPEPFLTYLPGSPVKEPSPEAFRTEPLQ